MLRINLVFIFIALFPAAIIAQLTHLQIFEFERYESFVQGRNLSPGDAETERGEIFLKNGEPLAINKKFLLVSASPAKIAAPKETAKTLSEILKLPEEYILAKLEKDTIYSPIKSRLTDKEVEDLESKEIAGVNLLYEAGRYFPQSSLASQAVGFVDANLNGQYGLEEYYNDVLAEEGRDIKLSIDYDVQYKAEKLLADSVSGLGFEAGLILVMDPGSGEILVLANFPNFDPNQYSDYAQKGDLSIFQNGATQKIFEPGSVFKPLTMAAAIEEGKITSQTTYVDEGSVKIGSSVISNYDKRVYGEQTMTGVLEKSINTGAVFAEKKLGHSSFLKYIEKFGLFEKTGIDLPEIYSQNKEFKKGYEINYSTASFGQGIELTPIQLARAYSALANGGLMVRPYLNKEQKPALTRVISAKTALEITNMLVSVTENGYGKAAKIPGYYVAGKTGTAQVPEAGEYSPNKTVQSFVGYFPAFSPRFLVLVKLDNPQTKTAEYSAIPIFRSLAEYLVNIYKVPPDRE
ncbi:MAG: penicillin-binding protein 2 [bacterium]